VDTPNHIQYQRKMLAEIAACLAFAMPHKMVKVERFGKNMRHKAALAWASNASLN
jgi:hypothetical protein